MSGAIGADGLGSIRYPAAYCGLTGLKPTFGRSAMEGHHIANTETIVSGPLCRDAADCRLLASAMFGEELPGGGARAALRIGVIRDPYWSDSAPGVREACESALEALRVRGRRRADRGRAPRPGPDPPRRRAGRAGGGGRPPDSREPERARPRSSA